MKRKGFMTTEEGNSSSQHCSDVGNIASHVFGQESMQTIFTNDAINHEATRKSILQNTNGWIHQVLERIEPPLKTLEEDNRPGRIGNSQVRFDSTAQTGTFIMSADRLHAEAQSNFSSVRANACFYTGKWQYEVQLESKGVMQLGWAMAEAEFTPETGVGDSVYSFSYDGNRMRKWNLVTSEYGENWQVGDIIGCTIDIDTGSIHFYRNGKDLGEAFSSIPQGPGCVYYPAVSLAFEEKIQANFGSVPFKHPVDSFLPAQQPPVSAVLRTNQLLHWLYRLSGVSTSKSSFKDKIEDIDQLSSEAINLMFSEIIISHLTQFLNRPYVIEACIVPFLQDISAVSMDKKSLPITRSLVRLNFFCDSLMVLLEPDDFKELSNAICLCLVQRFNQTSQSLHYVVQKNTLRIFADISQNTNLRIIFLKQLAFFKTRITELMDVKLFDMAALKTCVPQAWWEEACQDGTKNKEDDKNKQYYLRSCQAIRLQILELEALQENVLILYLNNNDGTSSEASSRKHFLHIFRKFLKESHANSQGIQNVEMTSLPVALCFFHRLVSVARQLWERDCAGELVHVPLSVFYDGVLDYFAVDRLGGVLSHLINSLRTPLAAELGPDHRVFREPPPQPAVQPSVQVQIRGIDTTTGVISSLTRWINISGSLPDDSSPPPLDTVTPDPLRDAVSLCHLLDGLVLMYHTLAHKQLHKVSTFRDDMDKYITTLNDAKSRLALAKTSCPEAAVEIEKSIHTLRKKIEEQSRVAMSWVRGSIFTPEKRFNLVWLLRAVLLTLELASQRDQMFAFVPEFYIDTLVEIFTALRNYFSPTLPLEELAGYKQLFVQVAEFVVKHFSDPRVVNLGSKDTLIEALAGFITKKQTMECLESISPQSQENLVKLLLKPYDNRPWGQSNWILMRMWQGNGFAFRYKKSPHLNQKLGPRTPTSSTSLLIHQSFDPCPSIQYQQLIARTLSQDQELAAEFLNSVLKQLNWSFSEFISMMQEIQNLSKRPERVIIDTRQLRVCATCFDFVLSLLRVLEMLCTICLPVFTSEGSENLLERLCQLLSQVLLRVTTPGGCFSHVISLDVPDLDSIDQFPVLSAVVGVLVALLAEDITNDRISMTLAARTLLSEPAFQIDNLKYILGQTKNKSERQDVFSLSDYPQAVSVSELETVSRLIMVLSRHQSRMSTEQDVDEEELCPICCALPLAVTFTPCHHQSCKSCITHHLMDCKECFFCKTIIKCVVSLDGKVLYDASSSAHKVTDVQSSSL